MTYTGPIFRPPPESTTPLLQVTVGCAHNKCRYCTMYKGVKFTTEALHQIEEDILELKRTYGHLKRIFLVNGDAFVLSGAKLKAISDKIIEHFPEIETITMYASIRNIMTKTDEDLVMLRNARINDLWIGFETGSKDLLTYMNKGYTLEDVYKHVTRLKAADIRYNGMFMLGAAGKDKGLDNAKDTAQLINTLKPQLAGFTTMGIFDGSDLAKDVGNGLFQQASELEVLQETIELLKDITVEGMVFATAHPSNMAPIIGTLPKDKDRLITTLHQVIETSEDCVLTGVKERNTL